MSDPLIAAIWLVACIVCAEIFCEGFERNQPEKKFFSTCFAVMLAAFGLVRWL